MADALAVLQSLIEFGLANPLVQSTLVGLVRGVAGWLQHAVEDGKISMPEISEFVSTILRILPQAIGLSALGIPSYGALFSDVFVTKVAKIADKK